MYSMCERELGTAAWPPQGCMKKTDLCVRRSQMLTFHVKTSLVRKSKPAIILIK